MRRSSSSVVEERQKVEKKISTIDIVAFFRSVCAGGEGWSLICPGEILFGSKWFLFFRARIHL